MSEKSDKTGYSMNLGAWNKVFAVPSCVVEKYIKIASGSNIKVLLYYLHHAGRPVSVEEISKATGVRNEDCEDALTFWSEAGLLRTSGDEIVPFESCKETKKIDNTPSISEYSVKKIKLERDTEYYPKDIVASIHASKELDFLFDHCGKLFGRELKHAERNMLMLLIEEICIPIECTVMLIDYCHSINKATPAYIKAIAADWVERDIMTVKKVEEEIRKAVLFRERESEIKKLFEIDNALSKNQKALINKWIFEYGFSMEMLEEAYQKTLDGATKLSFPYMNKILETWHNKGVKNKSQIEQADSKRKTEKTGNKETSFDIDEITRASMERYSKV